MMKFMILVISDFPSTRTSRSNISLIQSEISQHLLNGLAQNVVYIPQTMYCNDFNDPMTFSLAPLRGFVV